MYTHLFDHLAMINTLKCHGSNRWDKDLRACCMCGLLKNERMWLEFGCENCPFLIDPGASKSQKVRERDRERDIKRERE